MDLKRKMCPDISSISHFLFVSFGHPPITTGELAGDFPYSIADLLFVSFRHPPITNEKSAMEYGK
ncbi:MAG TPA: hypothetical protein PLD20_31500 [Blastocatellia bacterium]|nr:hypothetical protein [Blastocatellia bacterium]HMZ22499.1 hypothetical protein [Blastocatellia bacterium]HNG31039.1 hypothetical protein [Blastocatellia bacterium]